jgi:ribosomal protein S18 acetylase RimI-like enzyme
MTIEIRRLGPGDAASFDRIADGVFDHAIDRDRLRTYLATPGHYFIAAIDDGRMIGQLAAMLHRHPDRRPTELYIDELAVDPAYQRRSLARRMLDEAFELGRELGCEEAWVGTEPDNLPARGLYETRTDLAEPVQSVVMYVYKL